MCIKDQFGRYLGLEGSSATFKSKSCGKLEKFRLTGNWWHEPQYQDTQLFGLLGSDGRYLEGGKNCHDEACRWSTNMPASNKQNPVTLNIFCGSPSPPPAPPPSPPPAKKLPNNVITKVVTKIITKTTGKTPKARVVHKIVGKILRRKPSRRVITKMITRVIHLKPPRRLVRRVLRRAKPHKPKGPGRWIWIPHNGKPGTGPLSNEGPWSWPLVPGSGSVNSWPSRQPGTPTEKYNKVFRDTMYRHQLRKLLYRDRFNRLRMRRDIRDTVFRKNLRDLFHSNPQKCSRR